MACAGFLRPSALIYSGLASPRSYRGLVAWYDFSLSAALFEDTKRKTSIIWDGRSIGGVADLSGAGNHLFQESRDAQPQYRVDVCNGRAAAIFDGDGTMLTHEGISGVMTAAVVYKQSGRGSSRDAQLFASNDPGVWHEALVSSAEAQNQWVLDGKACLGKAEPDDAWHINLYLVNPDPPKVIVHIDQKIDLEVALEDVPLIGDIRSVGGRLSKPKCALKGTIGEVVFYERTLSLAACTRLERWLSYKWAIGIEE